MEGVNMKKCPLCQNDNQCTVSKEPETCWCMTESFPKELLTSASKDSCICKKCVNDYKEKMTGENYILGVKR
ncbi:cysteine-rich CWC family protein [Metabacillus litoralis]|uniref:cysteine-rich CWC family protein n=2 Tax=Metabacillus litoralis TaxID=152268 RepID=UPI001BA2E1D7|nr:cysteine-rich CWC family protein [Metabacillus litoralis]